MERPRPSIEALLSRRSEFEDKHPFAQKLKSAPMVGSLVRAWERAARTPEPRALWASLPPLAA